MNDRPMIRYIVFFDQDLWVAQGLEVDICTQAPTREAACVNFEMNVRAEEEDAASEGRSLFDIGPAPEHYFSKWNQSEYWSKHLAVA